MSRSALMQSTTIAGFVLLGCAALVLMLVFLLSKKEVKPIAESYEKQKQFVTDANHELKTPLTLILANLDIAESELGKNEWLDDIRAEGHRMTELVNQLVALSHMDEEGHQLHMTELALGTLVSDTVSEFELHRLFDRFYRADKARCFTGGYGVGLSMAKAIAEKHKGEVTAYAKDSTHIGFRVVL